MTQEKNRFQVHGRVKLIKGSILTPENAGLRFVLNVNNMLGTAESPLYPLFDKKWKKVREEARGWYTNKTGAYKLGAVNTTAVQSDVWVIHMLCQDAEVNADGATTGKLKGVDVSAVEECLKKVAASAKYEKATVHVSTLLADVVPALQELLNKHLVEQGVSVYYYQEPDAN